jgi:hypothetical protein
MNPQPTIFISSIVSEFYDLRGALKYFLGKSGFRVLLSEEPDFGADCGIDSLDNCKKQIEKADYFLLIIGNNSGTIFQSDCKDTTVTFEEFRHYISLVKAGKTLNFIAFVRKQSWDNYSRKDINKIHPIQIELINELTTNSLFNDYKIGRWRYTFDRFSDIITILETNQNGLFLETTRKAGLYKTYIKREIYDILKSLLEKNRETSDIKSITELIDLPEIENLDYFRPSIINANLAARIRGFLIVTTNKVSLLRKINRVFNYISQGEFSFFDTVEEKYILPEYVKLTIQSMEMLEKILDNLSSFDFVNRITKNPELMSLDKLEYSIIRNNFVDLKIVIFKLVNLTMFFNNNWIDLEKKPDKFYSYGRIMANNISDDDLINYCISHFKIET